jgi:hypothetical protein
MMAAEIVVSGRGFAKRWPVGFGISHIDERGPEPLIRVAAVDLATGDEASHDVHLGEPFDVAGQTRKVEELRHPVLVQYEIVLRRVA